MKPLSKNYKERLENAGDIDRRIATDFIKHPALVLLGRKSVHYNQKLNSDNTPTLDSLMLLVLLISLPFIAWGLVSAQMSHNETERLAILERINGTAIPTIAPSPTAEPTTAAAIMVVPTIENDVDIQYTNEKDLAELPVYEDDPVDGLINIGIVLLLAFMAVLFIVLIVVFLRSKNSVKTGTIAPNNT